MEIKELEQLSREIRFQIVKMSHEAGTAHLGSSLSCLDILIALYFEILKINPGTTCDPNRDRFILSKGHAAPALYSVMAYRGFFPKKLLETYAQEESGLEEHPIRDCVPGIELATGSLGHGLSVGTGMALAAKLNNMDYKTYVLLSDGECNEGSVWEAAMLAPAKKLGNLVAIIDFNKWQATGRSCEVTALQSLSEKWKAFEWNAYEVDGHNMEDLLTILKNLPAAGNKPAAIIAHTVKGKGISFMEDDNDWHYRVPTEEEVILAKKELGL